MPHHMLVIAHTFPLPDLDGGSLRILRLMQMMRELGWDVTVLSAGRAFHGAYEARAADARALLADSGIQAIGPHAPLDYVEQNGAKFDAILLAVTLGSADAIARLRRAAPDAVILYDTIELTFVSMVRAAQLRRSERLMQQGRTVQASQLQLAGAADYTLVVTDEEAALLQRLCPAARVRVLSNVHTVAKAPPGPEARRDLLFVGNFVHMPNRDAAAHFAADIWPSVRQRLPGVAARFVGLPVPEIEALDAPGLVVTGQLPDLSPLFRTSRLSIAPLRFGAGIKGKVLEAMGQGLPVVMTPVAAEGIGARHEVHALIAATPPAFGDEIVRLYQDDVLWRTLSTSGQALVQHNFSYDSIKIRLAELLSEVTEGKSDR